MSNGKKIEDMTESELYNAYRNCQRQVKNVLASYHKRAGYDSVISGDSLKLLEKTNQNMVMYWDAFKKRIR